MAVGIGAAGIVGVAHEVTPGTYAAPTKYIPVTSESIQRIQEVNHRRHIKGVADVTDSVTGPARVEGRVTLDVREDILAFLLYGARMDVVKAGAGPYTYTFSPSNEAEAPNKTLSITVVRNNQVFGYVGCVVGSLNITTDNGVLIANLDILGRDEATQSAPTPTWPSTPLFGADAYTLEIPTSTPVTTIDNMNWTVDDNAEAVYRLGAATAAAYVKFGERSITASVNMDFEDKTQYDKFKAVTAEEIRFYAERAVGYHVEIFTRSSIMSSYEIGIQNQGDLIRAAIEYQGVHDDGSGESYQIEIGTDENIT